MLTPKSVLDCVQQTALPSVAFSQTWFDISLNYEQKVLIHDQVDVLAADMLSRKP